MLLRLSYPWLLDRDGPRISSWGGGGAKISEKKISNTQPYSINKLSTKKNTQKSLFLNILRHNHLPTKTKDTKHYYILIQSSMKRELDALSNLQNHLRLNPNQMSKLYHFQCITSKSPSKNHFPFCFKGQF